MFSHEGLNLLFNHFIVLYFYVGKQMVLTQSVDHFTFGTRWPPKQMLRDSAGYSLPVFYSILCKYCCLRRMLFSPGIGLSLLTVWSKPELIVSWSSGRW
jgi:hypothetical protein